MVDIVSTISNVLQRWISWISLMKTSRELVWGVIMCVKTLLLSHYCPRITFMNVLWDNQWIYKISIQLWSNTPLYIAFVYALEILQDVSVFLVYQYMKVPLNRWSFEVAESLSERYLVWYVFQYLWSKIEYNWVYISGITSFKKQ